METFRKKGANNLRTWRNSVFFFNFTFSISIYIICVVRLRGDYEAYPAEMKTFPIRSGNK